MEKVKQPDLAGSWYPDNPAVLSRDLEKYFNQVPRQNISGDLVGLISPHAGYRFSGAVAAYAYKLLEGSEIKTVIVLAPSHRHPFRGASLYDKGPYLTPLGEIPVDRELAGAIKALCNLIGFHENAHHNENSLELQLPFLQHILGDFLLVPILLGHPNDLEVYQQIAQAIVEVCKDKKVILVASSDLSHFHPYKKAQDLDNIVADYVRSYDPEGLYHALTRGKCEACGSGAIITAMFAAKQLGADQATVLHYANSGDVSLDRSSVVGYMAAALYQTKQV
jgi:AmmeMemoRadiSam system protein B